MSGEAVCKWPVVARTIGCCGKTPCAVQWVYACAAQGGCPDRSTCGGCSEPVFPGEPGYDAAQYTAAVARAAGEGDGHG